MEISRKLFAAALLAFIATMATLACRQFDLAPDRPSPDFRAFGPQNAKIQIYEYTDFACPACKAAEKQIQSLVAIYPDSVRINFKHYPLSGIHPWSFQAAAYADCAGRQGKFMEYAVMLFENQETWAQSGTKPAQFSEYAKKLGLDLPALEKCSGDPATINQIKMDVAEGDMKRVPATPTFFINGRMAVGAAQFLEEARHFDNIIKTGGR